MTSSLVIECGIAQTRAALIENDIVSKFWFGPARGDETQDIAPRVGRQYVGRILSINHSLNAAFVDVGDGLDSFLPLGKVANPHCTEGALIGVSVKSPPRQGKGAVVKYLSDIDIVSDVPGRLPPLEDAAIEAVNLIGTNADTIIIDDGQASALLKAHNNAADVIHEHPTYGLFETYDAQSALEAAFERRVSLNGGGELIIDEAQALTAIDVDSAGLKASSPARLREKVSIAAAYEAARQIKLRNIGGHIVIDFPLVSGQAARTRFNDHLKKAMVTIDGAAGFGFSKTGLFCFTATHHAQSLLECFTESVPTTLQSGRRYTVEFQAKTAMRTLEQRLRASRGINLHLRLGLMLYAHIEAHGIWLGRLKELYGDRFQIVADEKIEEREFEFAK